MHVRLTFTADIPADVLADLLVHGPERGNAEITSAQQRLMASVWRAFPGQLESWEAGRLESAILRTSGVLERPNRPRRTFSVYDAGLRAYLNGISRAGCPYGNKGPWARQWNMGWNDACMFWRRAVEALDLESSNA